MRRAARGLCAAWAGVCAVTVLAGCGYTTQSSLDPRYQTIYVDAFKNYSKEYDLTAPLTNAVIRKFLNDGRLKVVERANADLILEGAVTGYILRGLTYDKDDNVTQYLSIVTGGARVTVAGTGEVLWEDREMAGETSYYTRAAGQSSDRLRGNAEAYLATVRSFATEEENRGASEALEQLASDILYRTVEPW